MQYLVEDWLQIERELMRERGLWGPLTGSQLDKWMLDVTEGKFTLFFIKCPILFISSNVIYLYYNAIAERNLQIFS